MDSDEIVPDAGPVVEENLDEKYPNRPHNHSPTIAFHELYLNLFDPLSAIKKKPANTALAKRRAGPKNNAVSSLSPSELRRDVITRFFSRWRKEVGDDIYPALRLILPEKDRDRPMYGMKEKVIGKMLVKIMKINKESEDGYNLLNWKLPGQSAATRMAGDFAGRCHDVLSKRPMKTEPGDMTIEEVNTKLDELSVASKEEEQATILAEFYRRMNPDELTWLIRIILRQMKVGATERTVFHVWHPDAESLYSISSNLRRVCWELHDPNIRLEAEDRGIGLMQCFQPQLAQFQLDKIEKMVTKVRPTGSEDAVFWIEEKMDGERMQLHMAPDNSVEGGRKFAFWSRKAKEYTYLYGNGIFDKNGALTRHLKDAFADGVSSIILDGEMITWDPEQDAMVPFGTLKTAALGENRNPFANGPRPLFRVFDILHLNGTDLTKYTLRDRRNALQKTIRPVHRRFEILPYEEATTVAEVEACLRNVVAEASEGLVLKNPGSPYRLNERHNDWIKVKPDYMTDFGESLDVTVIGGYYGKGHRGGKLASFLCGLRVDGGNSQNDAPEKFWSFCKVGGGYLAADLREIEHITDDKWKKWDSKRPPTQFIELAGGDAQHEKPDMWIQPSESFVLCVKASSIATSDEFRMGLTLRFPRFKRLRKDKNWKTALSVQEFLNLKSNVDKESREKEFQVDNSRKKRFKRTEKKPLTIAGYNAKDNVQYAGPSGHIFDHLNFFIMTDASAPEKKSKGELEQLVKANGGKIFQTNTAAEDTICIAERRTVKVASLQKHGNVNIVKPSWILDCVKQNEKDVGLPDLLLPFEPRHMFFIMEDRDHEITVNVDRFSDSYARDVNTDELMQILKNMAQDKIKTETPVHSNTLLRIEGLIEDKINSGYTAPCGWLFRNLKFFFCESGIAKEVEGGLSDIRLQLALNTASFAGANIETSFQGSGVTHIIVNPDILSKDDVVSLRKRLSERVGKKIPHLVSVAWVEESWGNGTLLDEERFHVSR